MKKRILAAAGIISLLVLAGCQTTSSSETEALRQQVAQLEQQVTALEKSGDTTDEADAAQESGTDATADTSGTETTGTSETPAAASAGTAADATASGSATIEELTEKVQAFEEKVSAEAASSSQKAIETFFELKREGDAIDDELDYYEDGLELQYRNGTLTRDEYRTKEREAELLEDRLDDAEDTLEFVFGIDD